MKPTSIYFLLSLLSTLLLNGCATQVKVRSLEPAEIDRAAALHRIAVLDFKNDSPGLSGKIQTVLSEKNLDGKPFFTVVDRKNLSNTLKEQKLQYSGLLKEGKSAELGELLGAQALISGEITTRNYNDSHSTEKRSRCVDKKCKQQQEYNVSCTTRQIHLGATIQMVDVQQGDIITSQSPSLNSKTKKCNDDSKVLPNPEQEYNRLAIRMANTFGNKLTPNYITNTFDLLDDPDIRYTSAQKDALKYSLKFIEENRLDKAEIMLGELFQETEGKSYVAAYNLGAVYEALGQYEEAKTYYTIADELQTKPISEINAAVNRINQVMANREAALKQLQR